MFEHAVPVLPARDIGETVTFYRERLGFAYRERLGFAEGWIHEEGAYGGVWTGDTELHFWRCDKPVVLENCSCRIRVPDARAFYRDCQAQNIVHPNGSLEHKPWETLEFAVLDVSGNLIWFYERLEPQADL